MLVVSDTWKAAFPGAHAGILAVQDVANPPTHPTLERQKEALEEQLRARFAGGDRNAIEALAPIQAYAAHYRRFKKTYHVQLQLESIALRGKPIPSVATLVEAMFMAEVKNLLLTAGHDLDALQRPITLDVSKGGERYTLLRGQEQSLKPGDMLMADRLGVISSVLYGPDQRTQITARTRRALFAVYAPAGIGAQAVHQHLEDIRANVALVAPEAEVLMRQVFG